MEETIFWRYHDGSLHRILDVQRKPKMLNEKLPITIIVSLRKLAISISPRLSHLIRPLHKLFVLCLFSLHHAHFFFVIARSFFFHLRLSFIFMPRIIACAALALSFLPYTAPLCTCRRPGARVTLAYIQTACICVYACQGGCVDCGLKSLFVEEARFRFGAWRSARKGVLYSCANIRFKIIAWFLLIVQLF